MSRVRWTGEEAVGSIIAEGADAELEEESIAYSSWIKGVQELSSGWVAYLNDKYVSQTSIFMSQ